MTEQQEKLRTEVEALYQKLANQETGSLESDIEGKNGHDAEKVLAFLTEHQAPYLPAESILSDALRTHATSGERSSVWPDSSRAQMM